MEGTFVKSLIDLGGSGVIALVFYFIFKHLLKDQKDERAEWHASFKLSHETTIKALGEVAEAVTRMTEVVRTVDCVGAAKQFYKRK